MMDKEFKSSKYPQSHNGEYGKYETESFKEEPTGDVEYQYSIVEVKISMDGFNN